MRFIIAITLLAIGAVSCGGSDVATCSALRDECCGKLTDETERTDCFTVAGTGPDETCETRSSDFCG